MLLTERMPLDILPELTRAWAEKELDEPLAGAEPLTGGWTSLMAVLTTGSGRRVVLRSMTKAPWRRHAPQLLAREARVHGLLADTAVPVPRTLAADPAGEHAADPSLLMTLLPGRLELERDDDAVLDALAATLRAIHAYRPDDADRPREFQSWATEAKRVVPGWSRRPELWRQAFAMLEAGPPPYEPAFLHRDFHLGNVLWDGGRVTGVVDWVETSWGPARLDVAHCRTYLAMLHGPAGAERFLTLYGAGPGDGYWDVLDVVGYLPDPVKVVQPWRDRGREITDETARERLEQHLAAVLERR